MTSDIRRFDSIERVVRDQRRRVDDLQSTVMARLATHVHAPAALEQLEEDVTNASDVADLKAALLAYIEALRG